jgi:ornithine cyclodeaminase
MLVIRHHEVRDILAKQEQGVLDRVRAAYLLHHAGQSALPHSTFLRLPAAPPMTGSANRIIALPAYLGGPEGAAGMKWIASFPGNLGRGLNRASAVMVLNSLETGRPEALIEGSLISAARTAASAALAAEVLVPAGMDGIDEVCLFGCGVINLTVLRYLRVLQPGLSRVLLHDHDPQRTTAFARQCAELAPGITVRTATDPEQAVFASRLVSIATTAPTPHLDLDLAADRTMLHLSLRDLSPRMILANHNVVDDPDHVCRERTSVHLAQQESGDRRFIDGTLADVLLSGRSFDRQPGKSVIFSPFGLGVLDIAVAQLVLAECTRLGTGVAVDDFLAG